MDIPEISSLAADARVLWTLARGRRPGADQVASLNAFYGPQAAVYDAFRERLLHGRATLLRWLDQRLEPEARLVELGAGTGRNLAFLEQGRVDRVQELGRIELVDLCDPLLAQARRRWVGHPNVHCIEADACCYRPEEPVDAVYLSYALTMIPNWRAAVANALAMLRPGGLLGVVDFYVSPDRPAPGRARHGALTRRFWPAWFSHDGVHPSPEHLPWLEERLEVLELTEGRGTIPYLPGLRVPYYVLLGRTPAG
jgi:S-adenosylmethionine-diacylgycerolhomoserine-N-methlytransferase